MMVLLLLSGSTVFSQQKVFKRLQIGDTIPDIQLKYTINGMEKSINTRALRGKVIILDYWNIWCGTCISKMPEMESFQKRFSADLQIFLVTDNKQEQVDVQFKKIAQRSKAAETVTQIPTALPSITGDTVLHRLFPHRAVPHHVWIDRNGKIKFIAGATDATAESISEVINGNQIDIAVKKDTGTFDLNAPLYLEGNGRQLKKLKYYAMIYKESGEYHNKRITEQIDSTALVHRFRCLNFTLLQLFRETTRSSYGQTFYRDNRLILESRDSTTFYWPKDLSKRSRWRTENLYSYDLAVPLGREKAKAEIMLEDLNRLLPYTAAVETRKVKCLVLVRNDKRRKYISRSDSLHSLQIKTDGPVQIVNGTCRELVEVGFASLDAKLKTPIVDGTGYLGKINISLSTKSDVEQIRKELQQYGLDLKEKEVAIGMLVIKDQR